MFKVTPILASKMFSSVILFGIVLAISSNRPVLLGVAGFFLLVTTPFHILAWTNRVNKW